MPPTEPATASVPATAPAGAPVPSAVPTPAAVPVPARRRTLSRAASGGLYAAAAMTVLGCSTGATAALTDYPLYGGQAARYLLAAALLLPLVRRGGPLRPRPSRSELLRLVLLAATGLFAFNVLLIQALRRTDPAAVGSVVGCTPLLLAVLAPVLARRRPQLRLLAAAGVVVAGAAVTQGFGPGDLLGFGCALGTLACEAAFSLLAVDLLPRLGPVRVSAYTTALAVPMFALAGLVLDGGRLLRVPTAGEAAALLYLAVMLTVVAFLLWYTALGRLGPERAGLFAGLIPVTAALSGAALGTGGLHPGELAGTVLVGVGVGAGITAGRPRWAAAVGG
ncbi:DMT family transporter [Kitasatospora sp. MBT63]|uniref:DMT family transporter n=1 Tax=Kitasatospora sp. MBT63 TaxID=1444768 RepID=UPI000A8CB805|nr:DMT family transporter [Kitasatospora sp. MBT63]